MSRNRRRETPSSYSDDEDGLRTNRITRQQTRRSPVPVAEQYPNQIQFQVIYSYKLTTLDKIGIGIILVLMAFWTVIILLFTFSLRNQNVLLGVVIGLMAYWGIMWIIYYVGWKLYWIMIAIGWMFGTAYLLTIMGLLQQSFLRMVH